MKNLVLFSFISFSFLANSQITLIPDTIFEQKLINQGIDSDGIVNGQVLTNDINNVTILNLNYSFDGIISDLTGIEDFIALEYLDCTDNSLEQLHLNSNLNLKTLICTGNYFLNDLDISENSNLEVIECSVIGDNNGDFVNINFSNNIKLETLICKNSNFSSLDLSNNINLKTLICSNDQDSDFGLENLFINLNLINNTNLEHLEYSFAILENIILPSTNKLTYIELKHQQLANIDVSQYGNLEHLDIALNPNLSILDISNNPNLKYLDVNKCAINNLDVTQNLLLEQLHVGYLWLNAILEEPNYNNNISNINLINNTNLINLNIRKIELNSINLNSNINLSRLNINENPIQELDLANNTNLEFLACENTTINTLNLNNNNNQVLNQVFATNNPNLTCIEVDNETDANNNTGFYTNWEKDTIAVYSEDCATVSIKDETIQNILLYPNPTKDILFIETPNTINIEFIKIYNLLGQQVLVKKDDFNQINLNTLKPAIYLVSIKTNKGIINTKIIKK